MINKPTSSKTILGIDPGYDRLGWAVAQKNSSGFEIIGSGLITTSKKDSLPIRYGHIDKKLTQLLDKHQPNQLAIETLFFSKNKKTALQVSETRGVIISTCVRKGLEIFEYTPNQIKLTVTGYGNADKKAVAKMVELELKIKTARIASQLRFISCFATNYLNSYIMSV